MSRVFKRPVAKVSVPNPTPTEAADLLQAYRAAKKYQKEVKSPRWKLAAAAGSNRRLLIGNSRVFKSPERQSV